MLLQATPLPFYSTALFFLIEVFLLLKQKQRSTEKTYINPIYKLIETGLRRGKHYETLNHNGIKML